MTNENKQIKNLEKQIETLKNQIKDSKSVTEDLEKSLSSLTTKRNEIINKQKEEKLYKEELLYFTPYVGKYVHVKANYSINPFFTFNNGKVKESHLYVKLKEATLEPYDRYKSVYLTEEAYYLFEITNENKIGVVIDTVEYKHHFSESDIGKLLYRYPFNKTPWIEKVECLKCEEAENQINKLLLLMCDKDITKSF